jgi:hypothetical protein
MLQVGDTMKNGATVLEAKGDKVLAMRFREFVVWTVDEEGNAFWGHYTPSVCEAVETFKEKTGA